MDKPTTTECFQKVILATADVPSPNLTIFTEDSLRKAAKMDPVKLKVDHPNFRCIRLYYDEESKSLCGDFEEKLVID